MFKDNMCIKNTASDLSPMLLLAERINRDKILGRTQTSNLQNLCWAVKNNYLDAVEILLSDKKTADVAHHRENEALKLAISEGNLLILDRLLQIESVRKNLTFGTDTILLFALRNHQVKEALYLLKIQSVRETADYDNNKALRIAAELGDLTLIQTLLSISSVRENAHAKDNQALRSAAQYKYTNIVLTLLQSQQVREDAHKNNNKTLKWAIINGQIEVIEALLEIKGVQTLAYPMANTYLKLAAQHNHPGVVRLLLNCSNFKKNLNRDCQQVLPWASRYGHIDIVNTLLEIKDIADNAHADNNLALVSALEGKYSDIAGKLLMLKGVQDNAHTQQNVALSKAIDLKHLPLVKKLLSIRKVKENVHVNDNALLKQAMQIDSEAIVNLFLDLDLVKRYLKEDVVLEILKKFKKTLSLTLVNTLLNALGKPKLAFSSTLDVDRKTWLNAFTNALEKPISLDEPEGMAKHILNLFDDYLEKFNRQAQYNTEVSNHFESAMEDKAVKEALYQYRSFVKPFVREKFNAFGNSVEERLLAIEEKIRLLILNEISMAAMSDNSASQKILIPFIEENKSALIKAENNELMEKARVLFSSNEITGQIAWRCYDREGRNEGWANLFVSPSEISDEKIFTTSVSSHKPLTLHEASIKVRKMAAYYFLLVHPEEGYKTTDAEKDFVSYLAQIKRAHNEDALGEDSPSCFPGTITRLARSADKSTSIPSQKEKRDIICSFIQDKIEETFIQFLEEIKKQYPADTERKYCETKAKFLSDAITCLNREIAFSLLMNELNTSGGFDISVYTSAYLNERRRFLNALEKDEQIWLSLEQVLKQENPNWFLLPLDRKFAEAFITSLSELEVPERLARILYQSFPPELPVQVKSMEQEVSEIAKIKMSNPFTVELQAVQSAIQREPALEKRLSNKINRYKYQEALYGIFLETLPSEIISGSVLQDMRAVVEMLSEHTLYDERFLDNISKLLEVTDTQQPLNFSSPSSMMNKGFFSIKSEETSLFTLKNIDADIWKKNLFLKENPKLFHLLFDAAKESLAMKL